MDGSPVNEQFKGDKHWRSLMSMHATGLKLGLVTFSWLAVASLAQGAMRSETGARVTGPSWVLAQAGQAKPSASVPAASSKDIDGPTMFATLCGFCHENGGRTAGKGPRLAGTKRSDEYIIERIKNGKLGAMPAFGSAFSDGQIVAILAYIRGLEDDGQ
jgi:mono/diheme cytochrome c family protein